MITVTIKTQDSCESVPVRDDTRVKDISLYLFNEYTTKGIKYTLNLHKNKELNWWELNEEPTQSAWRLNLYPAQVINPAD